VSPARTPPARTPPVPSLPRTWRPRAALLVSRGLAAFLVVLCVGGFLLLPAQSRAAVTWPQRITLLLMLAMAVVVLWVVSRGRIEADEDGLTVVNMLRTRRLEWAEVVRVRLGPGDPWVQLELDDGSTLPATGIQTSDGARARVAAAELRAVVNDRTRTDRDD
jgi:Bacterial PH domain